ncbi:MAG: hypothetical protein JXQ72_06285 [Anaerolineae bacterium]|nr:hypothetical protein [Anaerolineae bacterium]
MNDVVIGCPAHIRWVRDKTQVIIVDEQRGESCRLTGAEAALWSWLWQRHTYPQLVQWLAALLNTGTEQAGAYLADRLRNWHAAGLIVTHPERVDGELNG